MSGENIAVYNPEQPIRFESKYEEYLAAGFSLADIVVLPKVYNQISDVVRVITKENPVVSYASEHHRKVAECSWQRILALQQAYFDVVTCEVPENYANDVLTRSGSNSAYARVRYELNEHRLVMARYPKPSSHRAPVN